jgi:hypothetical protein
MMPVNISDSIFLLQLKNGSVLLYNIRKRKILF